jgi:transcriptional regulator with XRE-family HTH domain
MKKELPIVTRTAVELAEAIGLSREEGLEMELRCTLNDKIIAAVRESGLTHARVAKAAQTSRSRLTAILNRNTVNVSTDLLFRILFALGYRLDIRFSRVRRAA